MNILVLGGGGREHALVWGLAQSSDRPNVYIAPGNAGTDSLAQRIDCDILNPISVVRTARRYDIDLVVIGPEIPLVAGVADALRESGIAVVGPSQAAAQLEGSKAFSKAFMQRHGIPTASHATFSGEDFLGAKAYLDNQPIPIVIKASGLAAGKGAVVCHERADAEATLREMMIDRNFGAATDEVVIEAFMEGEEVSVFVLTDGDSYQLLAPAQDHKAALDGDLGPNTGGMGAYAPAPVLTPALRDRVISEIIEPVLEGMARENAPYQGILYVGLMITAEGPKVVEFNCRFGDPEAQVLIPLVAGNWVEIFHDMAQGKLHRIRLAPPSLHAATVVMASGGYPGSYEKGFPISGLNKVGDARDLIVFHAGTKRAEDGTIVTAGGRVLSVTGMGSTLRGAIDKAYEAVAEISFRDAYFRTDIGHRALTS